MIRLAFLTENHLAIIPSHSSMLLLY